MKTFTVYMSDQTAIAVSAFEWEIGHDMMLRFYYSNRKNYDTVCAVFNLNNILGFTKD